MCPYARQKYRYWCTLTVWLRKIGWFGERATQKLHKRNSIKMIKNGIHFVSSLPSWRVDVFVTAFVAVAAAAAAPYNVVQIESRAWLTTTWFTYRSVHTMALSWMQHHVHAHRWNKWYKGIMNWANALLQSISNSHTKNGTLFAIVTWVLLSLEIRIRNLMHVDTLFRDAFYSEFTSLLKAAAHSELYNFIFLQPLHEQVLYINIEFYAVRSKRMALCEQFFLSPFERDYKFLLCDRKLLICQFLIQMTRRKAPWAIMIKLLMRHNYTRFSFVIFLFCVLSFFCVFSSKWMGIVDGTFFCDFRIHNRTMYFLVNQRSSSAFTSLKIASFFQWKTIFFVKFSGCTPNMVMNTQKYTFTDVEKLFSGKIMCA